MDSDEQPQARAADEAHWKEFDLREKELFEKRELLALAVIETRKQKTEHEKAKKLNA